MKLLKIEIPIVTGASKVRQSATEAPSSITVVGAEEIKRYGYRTLADILQGVRGLHVSYDRTYSSLGFRGFTFGGLRDSNNRTLVLVDGHLFKNGLEMLLSGTLYDSHKGVTHEGGSLRMATS